MASTGGHERQGGGVRTPPPRNAANNEHQLRLGGAAAPACPTRVAARARQATAGLDGETLGLGAHAKGVRARMLRVGHRMGPGDAGTEGPAGGPVAARRGGARQAGPGKRGHTPDAARRDTSPESPSPMGQAAGKGAENARSFRDRGYNENPVRLRGLNPCNAPARAGQRHPSGSPHRGPHGGAPVEGRYGAAPRAPHAAGIGCIELDPPRRTPVGTGHPRMQAGRVWWRYALRPSGLRAADRRRRRRSSVRRRPRRRPTPKGILTTV